MSRWCWCGILIELGLSLWMLSDLIMLQWCGVFADLINWLHLGTRLRFSGLVLLPQVSITCCNYILSTRHGDGPDVAGRSKKAVMAAAMSWWCRAMALKLQNPRWLKLLHMRGRKQKERCSYTAAGAGAAGRQVVAVIAGVVIVEVKK